MRGGQHQVLLLLNALRNDGHESILLAKRDAPLWNAAKQDGFAVFPADVKHVWRLSSDTEMVHAHDARAHTLAALFSRKKFVVSRRVAFPVNRSLVSHWKYGRASRYLAVSQFVAEELAAADVNRDKIDVVCDAVSATAMDEWNRNGPAVALASRDPQKGRDLVEQAGALAQIPVIFADDLISSLRGASMFVYMTRSEGLGSAVLLAMNMGIPVIASRVGGLNEVLDNGVSGILTFNEPAAIATAMKSLKNEPNIGCKLIDAAHRRVAAQFTVDHLLRGTLACYRRALD